MTERLRELLGAEAGALDIPAPPAGAVLRQGRGLRRRNRVITGAAGLAAAVVVGGSALVVTGGGDKSAAPDPASPPISGNAVFSYGNQVFYDGPTHRAEIQDTAVKSLYYTSAGVVVRHGDNPYSDGGGPQRFSLVTPDGTVHRLGLETEETVHASDLDQPYIAYGEAVDGELFVVVHDVVADEEVARVPVGPTKETWFPVAIDGDTVYVQNGYDGRSFAVDWRAGDIEAWDREDVWQIAGGHAGTEVEGRPAVIDAASGETVVLGEGGGYFDLSPDGRYAQLVDEEETEGFEVYDVASGTAVTLPGNPFDYGWTAGGDLFQVTKGEVRTCDTATGECTAEPYAQPRLPQPAPVTQTVREPVCPAGSDDCWSDMDFYQNCAEHPDECEWTESEYVEEQQLELKLGGRTYES